jgi:hypothetical protein
MNYRRTTLTRRDRSIGPADQVARGLGWFSFGLGLTELIAGGALARWLGLRGYEPLIRTYGVREILHGIGTLSVDKTPALWGRVGGDAIDIATLVIGLRDDNPKKENVGIALAAVIGVTLLDLYCAQELSKSQRQPDRLRDYSNRSGFPRSPDAMRATARDDFETPPDIRASPMLASVSDSAPD